MHHLMPPSKTGWPNLNVVIFPHVMRLVLDDPKRWPPRRLLIKFTSQSGKTARFRLNQWSSNWACHVSGLGPSYMKIWTRGSSPLSGFWNAWTRIKNVSGASHLSNFWNFFGAIQIIFCHSWWPWTKPGYITMIRRQSNNQWSGSIAAHPTPKNVECKNLLEKFSPWFFGIKTAFSSLIIFQRAKLSTWSITDLCWCNWRTFWRKNATGRSPRGSRSWHDNAPAHWALATQKKLAYVDIQCLDDPPYSPDLAPSDYHLFPGLKIHLKGRHFSSYTEVTAAPETWLVGQPSEFFFEWLAKVRATG